MSDTLHGYRRYPAYKESAVEWPDHLPEHWTANVLKRVCTLQYGDAMSADSRQAGTVVVYGSNGPVGEHVQSNTLAPVIVVGRKGSFGKVHYVPQPVFAIDTTFFVDSRHTQHHLKWLYYVLRSARLDESTKDSTVPGLDRGDAYRHVAFVPPLNEQREIASFLDRETARIDALVAKKERLIELLEERRRNLITCVVTKGLDPHVPLKDSGIEWLGDVPRHWEIKRLWHLTPSRRRIMYGIVLPGPNVEGGVPIVKGGDVAEGRLRLDLLNRTTTDIESSYVRSRLRGGDLVFAIRGSIGEVAMVPDELTGANLTQDAARVAYTARTNGWWLMFALRSTAVFSQLEAGALGATIKGINIRDLKRALLPVPPLDEQVAIARYLSEATTRFDRLSTMVKHAVAVLSERRAALISAAVTGMIDVREEVV